MKEIWYTAVEPFTPARSDWPRYIEETRRTQLEEVVSLDLLLCPSLVDDAEADDWSFAADYVHTGFFVDLDYLRERLEGVRHRNLLAVIYMPDREERDRVLQGAEFIGYDLVEDATGVSALTSGEGFGPTFASEELNRYGLLATFARAMEVRQALRDHAPDRYHDDTEVWAVWRLED